VIPLGQLLCELTPGLLVPLGMDIVPRVSPEVLARALGHGPGVVTVFTGPAGGDAGAPGSMTRGDHRPFQVSEGAFATLERRSLAKMEVDPASVEDLAAEALPDAQVVNDAVGRFALWGFPDASDRKQLPPGSK